MNFQGFADGWIVETGKHHDGRGWLAATYDEHEFFGNGLNTHWPIQLQTLTNGCGIVRGMHWQGDQIKLSNTNWHQVREIPEVDPAGATSKCQCYEIEDPA